tara:strand:- start:345 stop:677 length:333 start_codon:yes stop_codon:yes gene_type:complete
MGLGKSTNGFLYHRTEACEDGIEWDVIVLTEIVKECCCKRLFGILHRSVTLYELKSHLYWVRELVIPIEAITLVEARSELHSLYGHPVSICDEVAAQLLYSCHLVSPFGG